MYQQGMEEDCVALLHLEVHSRVLWVVVMHSVIHFVHAPLEMTEVKSIFVWMQSPFLKKRSYLPFGVVMLMQGTSVCSRENNQAAILSVHFLHRSPSTDNLVNRPEGKVVQILVHRVTRCLLAYNNRTIHKLKNGITTLASTCLWANFIKMYVIIDILYCISK